jgi:predicted dehydrogenase
MKTILLIGAGNIGKRHLQGLLLSAISYNIVVVDSSDVSLENAKIAASEVDPVLSKIHHIKYLHSVTEIIEEIDVAIIATNANVRRAVIEQLFKYIIPKYIVLEKVLFQTEADHIRIGKLFYEKKVKAFVNCPRRYFSHYRYIKNFFIQQSINEDIALGTKAYVPPKISFNVSGSNWGLACNSIHFIDIFNYLTEVNQIDFSDSNLYDVIYESKRAGFIELMGTLKDDNLQLSISCTHQLQQDIIVKFQFNEFKFEINETKGLVVNLNQPELQIQYDAIPLSKLSHIFINEIILTGNCQLPSYFTSAQLHIAMLKTFNVHLEKYMPNYNGIAPIT